MSVSKKDSAFQSGIQAFRNGEYEQAVRYFSSAISHGLNTIKVYDSRAAALEKLGRLKDAIADSAMCVKLDPKAFQGYARAARLFLDVSRPSKAKIMICKAIELSRNDSKRIVALKELQDKILFAEAEELKAQECMIARLPTEMLHDIFLYVAKDQEFAYRHLKLAAVCRLWRDIITSDPRFWCHLVLPKRHARDILNTWISHSNARIEHLLVPINIGLDRTNTLLQQFISKNSLPLRTLIIRNVHPEVLEGTGMRLLSKEHVQHLEIGDREDLNHWPFHGFFPSQELITLALPSLEFFCYHGLGAESFLEVSMPRLKHFELNVKIPLSPKVLLRTFNQQGWQQLESFTWTNGKYSQVEHVSEAPKVSLPNLRGLDLQVNGGIGIIQFLSELDLPNLTSVTFRNFRQAMDSVIMNLSPPRVLQKLERVSLRHCHFDDANLRAQLLQMRNLRYLELSDTGSPTNKIIDALAESSGPSQETMCPALESLVLTSSPSAAEPCVRLVRSRNPTSSPAGEKPIVAPLQYLNIDFCRDLDPEPLRYLEAKLQFFSAKPPKIVLRRSRND